MFEQIDKIETTHTQDGSSNLQDSLSSMKSATSRPAITIVNAPYRSITVPTVMVDDSKNELLPEFSRATMKDRYLTEDENPQDRFANCVRYYSNDAGHANRMYRYLSNLYCIPATPILSNGGTTKGNLISCYLNTVEDNLPSIIDNWMENAWLGALGGGLGTGISKIRSVGEPVGQILPNGKGSRGVTSGAMSFTCVPNSITSCISQAGNRRASAAIFMDISHPEIEVFMEMRQEVGGDPTMKNPRLHHGVLISDAFIEACRNNEMWYFKSPKTGESIGDPVSARYLMNKLLEIRVNEGEPYIIFIDTVNKNIPLHHKKSNLLVSTSNLCVEVMLPTGVDHHGYNRTAVCALFQMNMETYDQWMNEPTIYEDVAYFMDNVLQDFIDNAGDKFINARYSASRERSIGIGMMGFHSFLQKKNIAFGSAMAKVWNMKFFQHMEKDLSAASKKLAHERGACPDAAEHGIMERFSNKTALAPTASVSIICGGASAGGDAIPANIYTHKTMDGSFIIKNKYLITLLESRGKNTKEVWDSILNHGGSVLHLDFLSDHEKDVYKTSFEIDPRWAIEHAADRQPHIDQSQSLNLQIPPDLSKYDLLMLHMLAYDKGIKSLYYLRSYALERANSTDGSERTVSGWRPTERISYDICLACQ